MIVSLGSINTAIAVAIATMMINPANITVEALAAQIAVPCESRCGKYGRKKSFVKLVARAFKAAEVEPIIVAKTPATIKPRKPTGIWLIM
jgi:hypothetical protein